MAGPQAERLPAAFEEGKPVLRPTPSGGSARLASSRNRDLSRQKYEHPIECKPHCCALPSAGWSGKCSVVGAFRQLQSVEDAAYRELFRIPIERPWWSCRYAHCNADLSDIHIGKLSNGPCSAIQGATSSPNCPTAQKRKRNFFKNPL